MLVKTKIINGVIAPEATAAIKPMIIMIMSVLVANLN
jgi:hypothetical protein